MPPSLLFPLLCGALLCLGGVAGAQEQESRINQILKPDLGRAFDLTKEKKFGSKGYENQNGRFSQIKSAYMPQRFQAKDYLTGSFHNEKSFWMGDFKYSVNEANTKSRFSFLLPGKTYGTKDVPTKAFSHQGTYRDSAVTSPTRDFRGKERDKFKSHLTPEQAANNGYRGDLVELKSIDDVRALLNKSK